MTELIAHLFGDYIVQNHWMALNKTKSSVACGLHVALYTLMFLAVTRSPLALAVIASTHFVIDRWSIAKRWPAFYGVGCEGWIMRTWREALTAISYKTPAFGGPYREPLSDAPPFLAVWLAIIVDNTIHLLINHLALAYC